MQPVKTRETTNVLKGPEGSDIEPLPVQIHEGMSTSIWELDDKERVQIGAGGQIGLIVMSDSQPPVALLVASPRCPHCGEPMSWSERMAEFVCAESDDEEDA